MAEPITLALVGTTFLVEGIKFLYDQTGELIKSWRDRRKKPDTEGLNQKTWDIQLPSAFEGSLNSPRIDFEALNDLEPQIKILRQELSGFVDGTYDFDSKDNQVLVKVDLLRTLLEQVIHQNIRFKGENHIESGTPIVNSRIRAKIIEGQVISIDAKGVKKGELNSEIDTDNVKNGGMLIGVRINNGEDHKNDT